MRFSTVFTVIATGAMAFAAVIPDSVVKRSTTDIQNAFTNLGSQCDTIIPKFNDCSSDDCTNEVVSELVSAINNCKNNLGGSGGAGDSNLANAVSGVVNVSGGKLLEPHSTHSQFQKIASGLEDHKNKCGSGCPNVLTAYGQVDSSLSGTLSACFNLSSGLVSLVSPMWVPNLRLLFPSLTSPYRLGGLVSTLKDIGLNAVLRACSLA